MTRVSTFGNYQSALANLMSAQTRSAEAQQQVSTHKIATDQAGFGRGSETLTAIKAMQSRINGFIDTSETVAARLTAQDTALNRVADGIGGARQAVADALASGRVDGLMEELQSQFQQAQDGLNAKHQGRYLFAGGKVDTIPVTAMTLAQLAAAPAVAGAFANDTLKQASRVDEGTTLQTGFLADEVGSAAFQIFRDIQKYQEGTAVTITNADGTTTTYTPASAGSISGAPGDAAKAFLTAQLSRLDRAREGVTDKAAANGSMQNRVATILESQGDQKVSLDELMGTKTDVDMAQAITDLELSQVAIQASAQVINQLRQVSLLNYLS